MNIRWLSTTPLLIVISMLALLISSCTDEKSPAENGQSTDTPSVSDQADPIDLPSDELGIALAPAVAIPEDIDDHLELPEDEDPVSFSYTEIALVTATGTRIPVEVLVADTIERRIRGLMFRTALPPNRGMLFAFPVETTTPFWNQNTPQDLDIAFLAPDGTIQEILTLSALDTVLIYAEEPYRYAVEMPQGWFIRNAAGAGDQFEIPDSVHGRS